MQAVPEASRGIDHTQHPYTDEFLPYARKYGCKIGGLKFIQERIPELAHHVLPMDVLQPHEEWGERKPSPHPHAKGHIIRASHFNDGFGLVDVLPTYTTEYDEDEKEGAISEKIARTVEFTQVKCAAQKITAYAEYENPEYDGEVVIGIQPFMPHYVASRLSIVEHPNQPDVFIASERQSRMMIETAEYDANGDRIRRLGSDDIELLSSLKQELKAFDLLRSRMFQGDIAIEVEQLRSQDSFRDYLEDFYIAQVRAFARKQVANFCLLPQENNRKFPLVFGVTPPEGIVTPVYCSESVSECIPENMPRDWALIRLNHRDPSKFCFQPQGIQAYIVDRSFGSGNRITIEHNHTEFIQKSGITIFDNKGYTMRPFYMRESISGDVLERGLTGKKMRIICDGRDAVVELFEEPRKKEFGDVIIEKFLRWLKQWRRKVTQK